MAQSTSLERYIAKTAYNSTEISNSMRLQGSLVALVTPFARTGELDLAAWRRLLAWHATQGTDALVVGGTTGESPTLSDEELEELVRIAARERPAALPLIAGTGTNSTLGTIKKTQRMAAAGASAALVVCPYYNKPTQAGLLAHFLAVAEASPIPVILYNVPGRTAVDLKPIIIDELSTHPNIVALKEAGGSIERIKELVQRVGSRTIILTGDDNLTLEAMAAGAQGVISVTANVAPDLMHQLCASAFAKDFGRARRIDQALQGLHSSLFIESNPIPTKWVLNKMGLIENVLRLPLTPLSHEAEAPVLAALKQMQDFRLGR
jgi:4-hydroxy-tetrahydrodipicolinate synthase